MSFLGALFGPDVTAVWQKFASDMGGSYISGEYGDGDRVEVKYEDWMIVFDMYTAYTTSGGNSYTEEFTRVRASFSSIDRLKFSVHRAGIFSFIGKLFNSQDIKVGNPEFDKAFIIRGNDEAKIIQLLSDDNVRALISAQHKVQLETIDDVEPFDVKVPDGTTELFFLKEGFANNVELKSLYLMFGATLNQLRKIGSIDVTK